MSENTQSGQGEVDPPPGFTVVVSTGGETPEGTEHVQASQPPGENKATFINGR